MKLVTFEKRQSAGWGVLVDRGGVSQIVDGLVLTGGRIRSVRQLLEEDALPALRSALPGVDGFPVEAVRWLPPVPDPGKILAVGFNYADHALESASAAPAAPIFFSRFADNLVGHDRPLLRPLVSTCLDYEGELAVIIGRPGRYVQVRDALELVAGYACFNDGSLRDFQKESVTAGKNFPATAPFGPWLVTADEVPNPDCLTLTTRLNGEIVQQSSTAHLIHGVAALIAYVSRFTPLSAGDIIATGTPSGFGARRSPPLWMKDGDVVEVEIEGVGLLRNPVVDESGVRGAPALC